MMTGPSQPTETNTCALLWTGTMDLNGWKGHATINVLTSVNTVIFNTSVLETV